MKRAVAVLLGMAGLVWNGLAATNDAPDFNEMRELLRANLPEVTDAELNRAAVDGLLEGLRGRVMLSGSAVLSATNAVLVSRKLSFEGGVAYVRVGQVAAGLDKEITAGVKELSVSNRLKGVVLDLRYAAGVDYAAAVAAADLFVSKPAGLLDFGQGMMSAKSGPEDLKLPLAVVINGETAGAAEGLAGALRASGAGLLLGSRTAGRGMLLREFTLKNGQRLSLASGRVALGNGRALTTDGLTPDIAVTVKADDERVFFADPFANLSKTNSVLAAMASTNVAISTNKPVRKRMTEAELVRKHREGENEDEEPLAREDDAERPMLRDPALVRAVDLLKGLTFMNESSDQ